MRVYSDFVSFAAHLERMALMGTEMTEIIADAAAIKIRDDAKAKLGGYQEAAGPFPAWAPLAAATQSERVQLGFTANDPLLRSGQLRDAIALTLTSEGAVIGVPHGPHIEPDGRVEDVGDIALQMEVGGRAPPRPFLGPAAFQSKHAVSRIAARAVIAWLIGENFLHPPQSIKLP